MAVDRFVLGLSEVVEIRFGIEPGMEALRAIRRIAYPHRAPMQRSMLNQIAQGVPPEALSTLAKLTGQRGYTPNFLSQPGRGTPEAVLEGIRSTPLDVVDSELRRFAGERAVELPKSWLSEPGLARDEVAEAWKTFWDTGMHPVWPRIRTVLENDISARSAILAREGFAAVISSLDPRYRWDGTAVLRKDSPWGVEVDCRNRGLVLVPTVLGWPNGAISAESPWNPTIYYPARNATKPILAQSSPAAALIGKSRALILDHLRIPARSSDVAAALGISKATATHHLRILSDAGLINSTKLGKELWHGRSQLADQLPW